jgi:hypothetical protein
MGKLVFAAGLVLVLASCGGGAENADPAVIESADGLAKLSVDQGSLPDGVTVADIQIQAIAYDSVDNAVPVVAVQLEPAGLVLAKPAALTITLPDSPQNETMIIHMSGDSVEFLEGTVDIEDVGVLVTVPVEHFSTVGAYQFPRRFEHVAAATPYEVSKGQTQTVTSTLTRKANPLPITLWLSFGSDPDGTVRFVSFSGPHPPISFEADIARGPKAWDLPGWDPNKHQVGVVGGAGVWATEPAVATCTEENILPVWVYVNATHNFTLVDIGEPTTHELLPLARMNSPVEIPDEPYGGSSYDLLSVPVGQSFPNKTLIWDRAESKCTEPDAAGSTSSSSSTSTSPPIDDDPDLQDLSQDFYDGDYHCPGGHQPDTVWNKPTDGKGNLLDSEPEPESARDAASDVAWTCWFDGSYGFLMTVKGDGESLSKEEYTSYQVSFIVNNEWPNNVYYDSTGFSVYVSWQHLAQAYAWQVFDSDRALVKGASVDIEWLDESTLQVIAELPGDHVEVTEMRTELDVYISDADDNHVYDHRDVAIWTAQP